MEHHEPSSPAQFADTVFQPLAYRWQHQVWQHLTQRYPNVGHALLLYGKMGCGKHAFQHHFTAWLLCQNKQTWHACGICSHCHWLKAGTHPQLKVILPEFDEKKQQFSAIKIEQIREMSDFLQQTVEGWKIICIEHAEQMNTAAANALLKNLEEPTERVIFILNSHRALKLPATIRSRVQQFALDRISESQAQHDLSQLLATQSPDLDQTQQHIALALADMMPLQAMDILQQTWFKQRQTLQQQWLDLVQNKNSPLKFSIDWLKQLDLHSILKVVSHTLHDCIAYHLQQRIKQSDAPIAALAQCYRLRELFDIVAYLNTIPQMLAQNVQNQLIMDELAIHLMNVPTRSSF